MDNYDVYRKPRISPRTLQTLRDRSNSVRLQGKNGTLAYSQINHKVYYKPEDVKRILTVVEEMRKSKFTNLNRSAYE